MGLTTIAWRTATLTAITWLEVGGLAVFAAIFLVVHHFGSSPPDKRGKGKEEGHAARENIVVATGVIAAIAGGVSAVGSLTASDPGTPPPISKGLLPCQETNPSQAQPSADRDGEV